MNSLPYQELIATPASAGGTIKVKDNMYLIMVNFGSSIKIKSGLVDNHTFC